MFLLAIAPFVLFLILLLWKKTSLLLASTATLLLTGVLTIILWQILPVFIFNSLVKGFLVAFDIFIIIFGAIFFLEITKKIGIIDNVGHLLGSFSKDYRVQVILLAWFLENFIEGTAGFGTPAAIAAPLLVSLGLSPIAAVIIALLGNSTSVVFGAAGTPIRVGFAGLNISAIPSHAALINCVGFLVPVFMLWTVIAGQKEKKKQFFEALPFAVWSGIAFVVPSVLTVALGQEFPSILGAVIGLTLVFLTTRLKLFVPSTVRTLRETISAKADMPLFKVLFPYVLLIVLLILGKLFIDGRVINFSLGANYSFSLFNPGWAFILAGLPVAVLWGQRQNLILGSIKNAFLRTIEPFLVIVCMSTMVQLMTNSGQNLSGLPSSLELMARGVRTILLPFWAPFVGAFGSFLTGSATISNIMFGNFLETAGRSLNLNVSRILALELVGASAGNMIALSDILAAETVVGLKNQERQVLRGVIIPCLIYLLLIGLIGILA